MASQHPIPSRAATCFPGGSWQRKAPSELGIDPAGLDEAVRFAIASETKA
jgi:hypothetical protein